VSPAQFSEAQGPTHWQHTDLVPEAVLVQGLLLAQNHAENRNYELEREPWKEKKHGNDYRNRDCHPIQNVSSLVSCKRAAMPNVADQSNQTLRPPSEYKQ
jgi:hypothetical protein